MKKLFFLLILSLIIVSCGYSQSVQDCIGAIPICQSTYNEVNAYSGIGNVLDYYGTGSCLPNNLCLTSETNSVWYTFQVQTSGVLDFRLTPNGANTDYDWALFNLTGFSCSDLLNTGLYSQLVASCNAANTYGTTGANSLTPNTNVNCQEPSTLNTSPSNNASVNVTAGETYYLNIQNWTGSTVGYLLDFSNSTASIYDNVLPFIANIDSSIGCGASSITVTFSENILCNTVQSTDFTLTGPDGNHAIISAVGAACIAGGSQEYIYTLNFSPPISVGGLYTLSLVGPVTDLCGNVAVMTNINFHILQVACSIINVSQPTCGSSNGSAEVSATQGSGNYTYIWDSNPAQTNSVASGLAAGTYSVTVTDANGCSCNSSVTLTTTSVITPTITGILSFCAGSSTTLDAGAGYSTYLWSTNDATQTISVTSPGTYSVTVSDAGGCSGTASVTVSQNPFLTPTISGNTSFCSGSSTTLDAGSGYAAYHWSNGGTAQTISVNTSGTYSVTVSDASGCTGTASLAATELTAVVVNVTANPQTVCPGNPSTLTATGNGTYSWSTTPPQTGASITVNPNATTTYYVTATLNGCTASTSVTVTVNPSINFTTTSTNSSCNRDDGTATAEISGAGYAYEWSTSPPQYTQIATGLAPGTYSVTVSNNGCSGIGIVVINLNSVPVAGFFTKPDWVILDQDHLCFYDQSIGNIVQWEWDFGDGRTGLGAPIYHDYADTGIYQITLIVIDINGCTDTVHGSVHIHPDWAFWIPNSFTPNADRVNDVFKPVGYGINIKTYSMFIYDRWGREFFSTEDINTGWNGTYQNKHDHHKAVEGAYVYLIKFCDIDGKTYVYKGVVTLVY